MSKLNDFPLQHLQFYLTSPYPCSYLANREARSMVAAPAYLVDTPTYSELIKFGFRRSGLFTYRPYCEDCQACTPIRVRANEFQANRTQRRTFKRLDGLEAHFRELEFDPEHYALYRRYQSARHPGGGMDQDNQEQFSHFLLQSNVATQLIEFRENGVLRMVSVVDFLADGLSSVYTFFEPDMQNAGFGTYNILWQINHAKELGLPYVYLGYWIEQCQKMSYKRNYGPAEVLREGEWLPLDTAKNA